MMRRLALGCVVACLSLSAGAEVSFSTDVVPILRLHCVGCHMTGAEPGGLQLHPGMAYESLVKAQAQTAPMLRVTPGDAEHSYLLHKLQGTHLDVGGNGVRMPFAMAPLSSAELKLIQTWITEGAHKN